SPMKDPSFSPDIPSLPGEISTMSDMVADVANELNNHLAAIMGHAQLLLASQRDPFLKKDIEIILSSASHCAGTVQSLLAFARDQNEEEGPVGINEVLKRAVELRESQLWSENIEIHLQFDQSLPMAMADYSSLKQVFLNLIDNAQFAIASDQSRGAKGNLTIRTESDGKFIRIFFINDGPGIAPENISRVFDPLLSSRKAGSGIGPGLSLSYGRIRKLGGDIHVLSQAGQGATFVVELPLKTPFSPAEKHITSRETIAYPGRRALLIDDEEVILSLMERILSGRGLKVDTALDGALGLSLLEKNKYDLIIIDIKMPGMGGKEFFEIVKKTHPDCVSRIIFSTGDALSDETREFLQETKREYLRKPFEISDFHAMAHEVLMCTG
ncbi:MAG: hybrid sensor histidine kinase/response regulator, partial [bacterium]